MRCYVIVWLNVCAGNIAGVGLSDTPTPARPVGHVHPVPLTDAEGDTLLQARERMLTRLRTDPDLAWTRALLGHPIKL